MIRFARLAYLGLIGALLVSGHAFSGEKNPSIVENKSAAKGLPGNDLLGNWVGKVTQAGAQPYTVELELWRAAPDVITGTTRYPELRCTGRLSQLSAGSAEVRLHERIAPPSPNCVSTGTMVVARRADGLLSWTWNYLDGKPGAFATLARASAEEGTASAPRPQAPDAKVPPAVPEQEAKGLPSDESANAAIDAGFQRWSSAWMFDRYIPGSARISDRGLKDGTYVIRGVFDFARTGAMHTIPFAAAFSKSKESYVLSNLCYNDVTSGMTDCINPSGNLGGQHAAAMQSRQFLGAVVLLGLVAAMSAAAEEETCVKRYDFFGEPYFYCY